MTQYLLQLILGRGIGDKAIKRILQYSLNSGCSLKTICETPEKISAIIGRRITQETIDSILNQSVIAEEITEKLKEQGIRTITEIEELYPESLKRTLGNDCPPVLFTKGNEKLLSKVSVGFCGSRKVSTKGECITEQCARQLAEAEIVVVSGYASGTDLAAHVSAVKNLGSTIFVLAEGILNLRIKPQVKPFLNDKNHLFVSQFIPDAQWSVGNAMKRNGVIIGLSQAMILVESGKTGGTFAAGEETLRRKKPLFVIDFEKPEVSAEANPYFLEHGGNPIRGKNGIPSLKKVFSALAEKNTHVVPEQLRMDSFVYS